MHIGYHVHDSGHKQVIGNVKPLVGLPFDVSIRCIPWNPKLEEIESHMVVECYDYKYFKSCKPCGREQSPAGIHTANLSIQNLTTTMVGIYSEVLGGKVLVTTMWTCSVRWCYLSFLLVTFSLFPSVAIGWHLSAKWTACSLITSPCTWKENENVNISSIYVPVCSETVHTPCI